MKQLLGLLESDTIDANWILGYKAFKENQSKDERILRHEDKNAIKINDNDMTIIDTDIQNSNTKNDINIENNPFKIANVENSNTKNAIGIEYDPFKNAIVENSMVKNDKVKKYNAKNNTENKNKNKIYNIPKANVRLHRHSIYQRHKNKFQGNVTTERGLRPTKKGRRKNRTKPTDFVQKILAEINTTKNLN